MTTKKPLVALLAAAAALALAGCGGGASAAPAASPTTSQEEQLNPNACGDETFRASHAEFCASADPLPEGPATEPAQFPGGIQARIVSVVSQPAPATHPDKGDTMVTVKVEFANQGTETFAFPAAKMFVATSMTYGANGYDANGWMTDGDSADLPARLVPGSTATVVQDFTLPAEGLDRLELEVSPDSQQFPVFTFHDVQALIRD